MKTQDPAEKWLAQQWLGANLDIIKPEEITKQIKEEIFLYIDKILKQTKQEEARVSLNLIFPYRKIIDKKEVEMESRLEGFLLPTHGGFIIKVNSKYPLFRKRVTVAHEIGHTFFYDIETDFPIRPFSKTTSSFWVQDSYAREIARAILLPNEAIKKCKLTPSITSLYDLSKDFYVTYSLLRIRLVNDLKKWDCVIFTSFRNSDKNFVTKKTEISKGLSFNNWHIPNLLTRQVKSDNKFFTKLYKVMSQVTITGEIEDEISIKKARYLIQSRLLTRKNPNTCITLIKKDES